MYNGYTISPTHTATWEHYQPIPSKVWGARYNQICATTQQVLSHDIIKWTDMHVVSPIEITIRLINH